MPLITKSGNILTKHLTDIEVTTPNIIGLQNQINVITAKQTQYQNFYIDTVNGDNNNDGLSTDTPVKDMERALDIAKGTTGGVIFNIIGDSTTSPRDVHLVDLFPTFEKLNSQAWYHTNPLEFQIVAYPDKTVNLYIDKITPSGTIFTFTITTFFTFGNFANITIANNNTFSVFTPLLRFMYNNNIIINNDTFAPFILCPGIIRFENTGTITLNTSINLITLLNSGHIDVLNTILNDAYAIANGLTART